MLTGSRHEVFIYCDSEKRHEGRKVAVTNFVSLGNGRWNERYTTTAAQGQRESGVTLEGNQRPEPGWTMSEDRLQRKMRSVYVLECRKCRSANRQSLREETWFALLNRLEQLGASQISLDALGATLSKLKRDRL